MYEVKVTQVFDGSCRQRVCYVESFDAPDWQTAVIAAAELAKDDEFDVHVRWTPERGTEVYTAL